MKKFSYIMDMPYEHRNIVKIIENKINGCVTFISGGEYTVAQFYKESGLCTTMGCGHIMHFEPEQLENLIERFVIDSDYIIIAGRRGENDASRKDRYDY